MVTHGILNNRDQLYGDGGSSSTVLSYRGRRSGRARESERVEDEQLKSFLKYVSSTFIFLFSIRMAHSVIDASQLMCLCFVLCMCA